MAKLQNAIFCDKSDSLFKALSPTETILMKFFWSKSLQQSAFPRLLQHGTSEIAEGLKGRPIIAARAHLRPSSIDESSLLTWNSRFSMRTDCEWGTKTPEREAGTTRAVARGDRGHQYSTATPQKTLMSCCPFPPSSASSLLCRDKRPELLPAAALGTHAKPPAPWGDTRPPILNTKSHNVTPTPRPSRQPLKYDP